MVPSLLAAARRWPSGLKANPKTKFPVCPLQAEPRGSSRPVAVFRPVDSAGLATALLAPAVGRSVADGGKARQWMFVVGPLRAPTSTAVTASQNLTAAVSRVRSWIVAARRLFTGLKRRLTKAF